MVQLLVRMKESVWTVVMVYVTHVSASLDTLVTTVKQTSVSAVFLSSSSSSSSSSSCGVPVC